MKTFAKADFFSSHRISSILRKLLFELKMYLLVYIKKIKFKTTCEFLLSEKIYPRALTKLF